jgi:cell division protease FtsH
MKEELKEKLGSPQWRLFLILLLVIVVMYVWQVLFTPLADFRQTISYTRFLEELDAENIASVTIKGLGVDGEFRTETEILVPGLQQPARVTRFHTTLPSFQGEGLMAGLREKNVEIRVEPPEESSLLWRILIGVLPWVLIIGVWIYIMRRTTQSMGGGAGGPFAFRESKAKLFDVTKPRTTFDDVAGMENVKQELVEVVEFLKNPGKFRSIGAKVPKGVLLVGAPGTGKTLLARATAGEAGVSFYSINASEFIEMFVGVGASRVRDMFKKARSVRPSIVFIDEIDAVGRTRGTGLGGGHDEREQTLNQILAEMDGFEPHEEIIIMAATNRPDVLDPALLRPGRFDRRIVIDLPSLDERRAILEVHVRDKKLGDDVDLGQMARGTPGMTGADLENLANEAALMAVRKNRVLIGQADFDSARDKVLMGAERSETISELERRITAYHEAGHALVALELPGTDPIHKVSIVPRGMAMGVTQLLPEEDRHYYPKSYLMNKLAVALAGRVAEKTVFDDLSTGAQSDLKEATDLAVKMVAQWGMSEKVGPLNLGRGEEHPFLGRELAQPKQYSEDMAWLMDQEIRRLIVEAEAQAEEILTGNREALEKLAEALLARESLGRDEVTRIVRGEEEGGS